MCAKKMGIPFHSPSFVAAIIQLLDYGSSGHDPARIGRVVRFSRLLDKHDLAHLPGSPVLDFKQNLDTESVILRPQIQAMTAGAAALKHIHAFVRGTALDAVVPAKQGFRAAPRQLLIKQAQPP